MTSIQLNYCIKKDLAVDYYSIVKFLEKVCENIKDVKLNHVEINSAYSICNIYTLYSITPCIINENNTYSTSSVLVLIDNETKNIIHCIESQQSCIDADKHFEILLKKYFKIKIDINNYLKLFIENNIKQKQILSNNNNISNTAFPLSEQKNNSSQILYSNKSDLTQCNNNKINDYYFYNNNAESIYSSVTPIATIDEINKPKDIENQNEMLNIPTLPNNDNIKSS